MCGSVLASTPPNIIVVFTDDHGYADLSCQGIVDDVRTPNIDRLAERGVRFTAGYASATMCGPSRAGLLTGRYQQRMGVETNADLPFELNTVPFPERLRLRGYRTGMTGKLHLPLKGNGHGEDPRKWGFDEFAMKAGDFTVAPNRRFCTHDPEGNRLSGPTWMEIDGYRLDISTDFAVQFIERNHDEPFFLYVAYFGPHTPLEAPEKYLSRFPDAEPPARRYALAMLSAIDDGVGRIFQTLEKYDLDEDTLIFFASDNGAPLRGQRTLPVDQLRYNEWDGSLNIPMLAEKGMAGEGGIRVPFLMSWPGAVPAGQVIDEPVSTLDVAATAAALTGFDGSDLDGVNLMPLVTGKTEALDRSLYWMLGGQTAVRSGSWKLLQTADHGPYLFDMTEPEPERVNLLAQYPEKAEGLQKTLDAWKEDIGRRGWVRDAQLHLETSLFNTHYGAASQKEPAKAEAVEPPQGDAKGQDGFERPDGDPGPNWTQAGFSISGGKMHSSATGDGIAYWNGGALPPGGFTLSADISLESPGPANSAGLAFHVQDAQTGYVLRFNGEGSVQLFGMQEGQKKLILNPDKAAAEFEHVPGREYRIEVSSAAPYTFDVKIFDAESSRLLWGRSGIEDREQLFTGGHAGLYSGNGVADSYDNFQWSGPDRNAPVSRPVLESETVRADQQPVESVATGDQLVMDARGQALKIDGERFRHWGGTNPQGDVLSANNYFIMKNGDPLPLVFGEFHPLRNNPEYWEESILEMKAAGLNGISSYVFWQQIEPEPGRFDFAGHKNLRRFAELCKKHGMAVAFRVGPFVNSEFIAGGLPVWLYGKPVRERSNDPGYLKLVGRYYKALGDHLDGMLWQDGGSVMMVQVENELATAPISWDRVFVNEAGVGYLGPTGDEFTRHYANLARLARENGLGAPFLYVTGWTLHGKLPIDDLFPTHGGYMFLSPPQGNHWLTSFGHALPDYRGKVMIGFSEIGTGAVDRFGYVPPVQPDGIYCSVFTRMAGTETIMLGYYMFHGGTNPLDEFMGFSYKNNTMPARTYDFHAPIGEFGEWRSEAFSIRRINHFMISYGSDLARTVACHDINGIAPPKSDRLRAVARMDGERGFLFFHNYGNADPLSLKKNQSFLIKTDRGDIRLPHKGGLNIPSAAFGIFPINLELADGVRLVSATARPAVRLKHDGVQYHIFSQVDNLPAEFVFESGTHLEAGTGRVETTKDGALIVRAEPATSPVLTVTASDGAETKILLLSEEQAGRMAFIEEKDGPLLVISDSEQQIDNSRISFVMKNEQPLDAWIFPPEKVSNTVAGGRLLGREADGLFERITVAPEPVELKPLVEQILPNKQVVRFEQGSFQGLSNIFMLVDTTGTAVRIFDVASGILELDHLERPGSWRVGLRNFRDKLAGDGLMVRAEPEVYRRQDKSSDMVIFEADEGGGVSARISDIRFEPEYRVDLNRF